MSTDTLAAIAGMIEEVLGGPQGTPITRETGFQDDLSFESIDIVVLGNHLSDRYGAAINFPKYLSELELDDIIALSVGDLVDYVDSCLEPV
ncbi:Acyl carrier protein [Alloactinosynnema sp. L-07]|uniref:acyl carrier protein n=1 Tax=Alloactinosynnema sp. L-07 TaxID=1653480 RepID=UPI00065EF4F2|nr:hypothetical protein [Alloactinosynnema sp. L-07]CRK56361.1 Acyl carrier protein [Alloactinosynnema sp. L-07]